MHIVECVPSLIEFVMHHPKSVVTFPRHSLTTNHLMSVPLLFTTLPVARVASTFKASYEPDSFAKA